MRTELRRALTNYLLHGPKSPVTAQIPEYYPLLLSLDPSAASIGEASSFAPLATLMDRPSASDRHPDRLVTHDAQNPQSDHTAASNGQQTGSVPVSREQPAGGAQANHAAAVAASSDAGQGWDHQSGSFAGLLVPGKQITPNLRLVRALGEGGMGRVWVAEHLTLETEVAVKLLNPEYARDEHWLARFRREAQSIAKIDSAHVVRVFDRGITSDNIPFIVMELLRGEDLKKRIERSHGLPLEEVVLIVNQICKALGRAHANGIVHRDVKPENIFLTEEGGEPFVKMLDFGIAKRFAHNGMEVTDDQSVFGTPYYMSPEQALSTKSVDHRADLWALAVVTYQMLTGERPFVGGTPGAVYVQINNGTYGNPSALRSELSPLVDEWFKIALNRDLEVRFSSAEEMSEAFRQAILASHDLERSADVRVSISRDTSDADACVSSADAEAIRTEVASARTIHHVHPKPRRIVFALFAALLAGSIAGWALWAGNSQQQRLDTPTSSKVPELYIERTAGLDSRLPQQDLELVREQKDAGAQAPVPSSSAPPAQTVPPKVKGFRASTPTLAPSGRRPIKDRGF